MPRLTHRPAVHPIADAAGITMLRFAVMWLTLEVAGMAGVSGWTLGLLANIAVTILAVVLVTRRRLWHRTGLLRTWHCWAALLALIPLAAKIVAWAAPAGVAEQAPGYAMWGLTLLLVGINEELSSRGVILERLSDAYRPVPAVTITAVLFGLQHLSALVLTSRAVQDVLENVVLSAIVGFAFAAYQWRFHWLWPLILIHATADWVMILAPGDPPLSLAIPAYVALLVSGLWHLWPTLNAGYAVAPGRPEPPRLTDDDGSAAGTGSIP